MNRKALTKSTVVYMMLTIIFLVGMYLFIRMQMNGASIWSDYYAKELTRIINSAEPNQTIIFDIQKATEVAARNNIPPNKFNEIFSFDNPNNEVCVKLSLGAKTCYKYFNDVDIIFKELKLGEPGNTLVFEITKPLRQTEQGGNSE